MNQRTEKICINGSTDKKSIKKKKGIAKEKVLYQIRHILKRYSFL